MLVNDSRRPARAGGARSLVGALVGLLLLAGCASRPATNGGGLTPSPGRFPVIGFLSTAGRPSPVLEAFLDGLRELGYEDGQNVRIEYRWAKGDVDALPALAAELARLPVDVLVAGSTPVIRAAMAATTTIPIVMPVSSDPVEQGFVASLARPGGNVTGLTSVSLALSGKRLEVLRDTVPDLSRVAVLWNADNPAKTLELAETESAAQELGIARVLTLPVRSPGEFEAAFANADAEGATALIVLGDPLFNRNHERIRELTRAYRLPAIFETPDLVRAGGLMAYGPAVTDLFRRAAMYVDKLLKGVPASELPVERPMRFYLVINLQEAQALDLTIPPRVLRLANEVVQ